MEMANVCIILSAYMFLFLIDTTQTNDITSKPTFYITSPSENGTNVTVWENQKVSFECLPYNKNIADVLSLHKGTKLIKDAFNKFSYLYTIDHVKCIDSGEYHCYAASYNGVNSALVTLAVQCVTDKCVDNEECRSNRSLFPPSCSNTSWQSKHCPVSCNLCSTGLPTRNGESAMTLTNHIVIFVTISGTFIIIGPVIAFFLAKARGHRIERRSDDISTQEAIVQRDITPTLMESNQNVYPEINKNHPPPFDHGECSHHLNSIYVPWELTGDNAERHQHITLSINKDTELSEN